MAALLAGPADRQRRREEHASRLDGLVREQRAQGPDDLDRDVLERLAYGRQAHREDLRHLGVVEADHADLGARLEPPLGEGVQHARLVRELARAAFAQVGKRSTDKALATAARARAVLEGRDYVIPDDVQALAAPILAHRLVFSGRSGIASHESARAAESVIESILRQVPLPERAHQDR